MTGERIGLYDVDSKIPNLALMKLSAWHRNRGDFPELYRPVAHHAYSKIYASKIFEFSTAPYLTPDMEKGGTGFDLATKLPDEIENLDPDYSIYRYPHSIGFTMRGCRFRCKFCVVPEKEGRPKGSKTIPELWTNRGSSFVVLLDNDFFGQVHWKERIQEMVDLDLMVNFSQGLNIRLITDEQAQALSTVKFRNLHNTRKQVYFAWDRIRDEKLILDGVDRVTRAGIKPTYMAFYVLVGFDSTPDEDMKRIMMIRDLGCDPYVMPYNRTDPYQKKIARWVNHKAVFGSTKWEDYQTTGRQKEAPYDEGQTLLLFAASLGEVQTLNDSDLESLRAGVRRVYDLMNRGGWHEAQAIRLAAGEHGIPASEGLRRMRELRKFGFEIERERVEGSRSWRYRLRSDRND